MGASRYFGGIRVVHRHRVGGKTMCCVHELTRVGGHPALILSTIDNGGLRVPLFTIQLDPAKLRYAAGAPQIAFYDEVTIDPRYEELGRPT